LFDQRATQILVEEKYLEITQWLFIFFLLVKSQTLIETNQYLKDPALRQQGINRSIASSSAIEGIYEALPETDAPIKARVPSRRNTVNLF
jgi:hypothetical protein